MPGNNGNHGKKGRSGRKPRSVEQEMIASFNKSVSPRKFREMCDQLLRMFWDSATVQDEEGNIVRLKVDAATRVRIWERLAAYAMGEPLKRVETGKIGELQDLLTELVDDGEETMGESETDREAIQASWIQAETPGAVPS